MKEYFLKSWVEFYKILWDTGIATGDEDGEFGGEYEDDPSPEYQWRLNFEAGDTVEIKTPYGYICITKDFK